MQVLELTLNMKAVRAWRGFRAHLIQNSHCMDEDIASQKGSMAHPESFRKS